MWWQIGAAVFLPALIVLWVVMHRFTDLGARSRRIEETDPEAAEALRRAEAEAAQGRMYF